VGNFCASSGILCCSSDCVEGMKAQGEMRGRPDEVTALRLLMLLPVSQLMADAELQLKPVTDTLLDAGTLY